MLCIRFVDILVAVDSEKKLVDVERDVYKRQLVYYRQIFKFMLRSFRNNFRYIIKETLLCTNIFNSFNGVNPARLLASCTTDNHFLVSSAPLLQLLFLAMLRSFSTPVSHLFIGFLLLWFHSTILLLFLPCSISVSYTHLSRSFLRDSQQ